VDEFATRFGGVDHFFGGALAHTFGITVSPDVGGENQFVALVNEVTDGLAYQMGADGEGGEVVVGEDFPAGFAVVFVFEGFVYLEVVAPAGEFDAVVAEGFGFGADLVEGQVGPLSGEEGDGAGHVE